MSSETRFKVLIVGAGHAGLDLHLPAYKSHPNVKVVALVDLDESSLAQKCKINKIPNFYTDLREALRKEKPDLVSITTPPATHFELAEIVLEHNITAIVEKPIFQSREEAEKILSLEQASQGFIIPVHNKLFFPGTVQAFDTIANGQIGEVVQVNAYWMVPWQENVMSKDPKHWCHKLPGGRWQELIPHQLYIGYRMLGEMDLVSINLVRTGSCPPHLISDEAIVLLSAKTGWMTIRLSANTHEYNFFEILGSRGIIRFDASDSVQNSDPMRFSKETSFRLAVERVSKVFFRLRHRFLRFHTRKLKENKLVKSDDLRHVPFIHAVIEFLMGKQERPVSWREALFVLEMTERIGNEIKLLARGGSAFDKGTSGRNSRCPLPD